MSFTLDSRPSRLRQIAERRPLGAGTENPQLRTGHVPLRDRERFDGAIQPVNPPSACRGRSSRNGFPARAAGAAAAANRAPSAEFMMIVAFKRGNPRATSRSEDRLVDE